MFSFIYLFFERGEGREKDREKNTDKRNINPLPLVHAPTRTEPTTQACALTGNPTGDLSLGGMIAPPTEPHSSENMKYIFL